MKWATRRGICVDRVASAWLISSMIDPDAEFSYYAHLRDVPDDTTPFGMYGCELGHSDDDVTFETIVKKYDLLDPVISRMGEIVHEATVSDGRFDAPESWGFDLVVRALSYKHEDEEVRQMCNPIFDAVESYLRSEMIGEH